MTTVSTQDGLGLPWYGAHAGLYLLLALQLWLIHMCISFVLPWHHSGTHLEQQLKTRTLAEILMLDLSFCRTPKAQKGLSQRMQACCSWLLYSYLMHKIPGDVSGNLPFDTAKSHEPSCSHDFRCGTKPEKCEPLITTHCVTYSYFSCSAI